MKELIEIKTNQEKINSYYRKFGFDKASILLPFQGFEIPLKINDIQVITTQKSPF